MAEFIAIPGKDNKSYTLFCAGDFIHISDKGLKQKYSPRVRGNYFYSATPACFRRICDKYEVVLKNDEVISKKYKVILKEEKMI